MDIWETLDGMGLLYDRAGEQITFRRYVELASNPHRDYRRVALTTLAESAIQVSTVWLGFDHGAGRTTEPMIFETMVFVESDDALPTAYEGTETRRWSTEAEALAGHEQIVASLSGAMTPPTAAQDQPS